MDRREEGVLVYRDGQMNWLISGMDNQDISSGFQPASQLEIMWDPRLDKDKCKTQAELRYVITQLYGQWEQKISQNST